MRDAVRDDVMIQKRLLNNFVSEVILLRSTPSLDSQILKNRSINLIFFPSKI